MLPHHPNYFKLYMLHIVVAVYHLSLSIVADFCHFLLYSHDHRRLENVNLSHRTSLRVNPVAPETSPLTECLSATSQSRRLLRWPPLSCKEGMVPAGCGRLWIISGRHNAGMLWKAWIIEGRPNGGLWKAWIMKGRCNAVMLWKA